jgi:hypothetical protein
VIIIYYIIYIIYIYIIYIYIMYNIIIIIIFRIIEQIAEVFTCSVFSNLQVGHFVGFAVVSDYTQFWKLWL